MNKIRIEGQGDRLSFSRIWLDDIEISKFVRAAHIHLDVNKDNKVIVELVGEIHLELDADVSLVNVGEWQEQTA